MSTEVLKQVIGRAVTEPEYRELLFSDPGKALEGLDLTGEEVAALKSLRRETFDTVAVELTERISRAGVTLGSHDSISVKQKVQEHTS